MKYPQPFSSLQQGFHPHLWKIWYGKKWTPIIRDSAEDPCNACLLSVWQSMMRGDYGASSPSEGHSPYPRPPATSRRPAGSHSQEDTLLILAVFSLQGCRFCKANSELFCKHSGSGVTGWLMVFWKASCCSCMRILLACCRSASRSSAVCRLQQQHVQYRESWHTEFVCFCAAHV